MGWKNACCSCSLNIRLALDVLEIICCNVIHFAMEGSHFYLQGPNNSTKVGELIWYMVVSSVGFVAQLVVLIKVIGCCRFSNHFLRLYYVVSSLFLLSMSTIITAISYAEKQALDSCNKPNITQDVQKLCLKQAINDINGGGDANSAHFGFEFAMFIITVLTGFLYIYSFILTFCQPKSENKSDSDAEVTDSVESKPSWPPPELANLPPSSGDRSKESSLPRSNPSAPPLLQPI